MRKYYEVCFGEEKVLGTKVIVPKKTSFLINNHLLCVYAIEEEGILKEIVTGLKLVKLDDITLKDFEDEILVYYKLKEVNKNEVAKMLVTLLNEKITDKYTNKISNKQAEQKNVLAAKKETLLKELISNYDPNDIIDRFIERRR